jgi:TfoX/Sxy family transcriptional regulator of competence genes
MAYNEDLANRIRQSIGAHPGLTEKKMFGGLAFLINGNMTIAASGQGGLLVRVNPSESDKILASSSAEVMVMRGKQMPGWLRVSEVNLDNNDLSRWVKLSIDYTSKLPKKK